MVVFTCNHCGDSLQKPKVEKHYNFVCRTTKSLTCVDCLKDFRGEEYADHTKCLTEEERYAAKGSFSNGVVKKGEVKQESWIEMIKSIINEEENLKPSIRNLLTSISNYNNVPRKKPKFLNFITSSSGGRVNMKDVEDVWNLIQKYKDNQNKLKEQNGTKLQENSSVLENDDKSLGFGIDELNVNNIENEADQDNKEMKKKKKKKSNNIENDDKSLGYGIDELNVNNIVNEVDNDKEMKKKKKKSNNDNGSAENLIRVENMAQEDLKQKKKKKLIDVTEEIISEKKINVNQVEENNDCLITFKKNKKNKKNKMSDANELKGDDILKGVVENGDNIVKDSESNYIQGSGKGKSKKKKMQNIETEEVNNFKKPKLEITKEENTELNTEKGTNVIDKFDFKLTILEIVTSKGKIPLKKLEKKVVKAYLKHFGLSEVSSEIIRNFHKKLRCVMKVDVVDNNVILKT